MGGEKNEERFSPSTRPEYDATCYLPSTYKQAHSHQFGRAAFFRCRANNYSRSCVDLTLEHAVHVEQWVKFVHF